MTSSSTVAPAGTEPSDQPPVEPARRPDALTVVPARSTLVAAMTLKNSGLAGPFQVAITSGDYRAALTRWGLGEEFLPESLIVTEETGMPQRCAGRRAKRRSFRRGVMTAVTSHSP